MTTAAVAGISPLMERSAALLELLTVHSTWEEEETTIFTVTATLRVTATTFRKERCEWDFDADTGWHSMTRIFIEEVPKAQQ